MVFGLKPECAKCKATESSIWQRDDKEQVLCTQCFVSTCSPDKFSPKKIEEDTEDDGKREEQMDLDDGKDADSLGGKEEEVENDKEKEASRSADKRDCKRRTRKGRQGGKGSIPKGKGRRYIFKKSVRLHWLEPHSVASTRLRPHCRTLAKCPGAASESALGQGWTRLPRNLETVLRMLSNAANVISDMN